MANHPTHNSLVYIVIVNWNNSTDTISCIRSLRYLNYSRFQIVVVDNASDDNSVSEIEGCVPALQVIRSAANIGFGGGCNLGIEVAVKAKADFIWLLNNDTEVDANCLTAMVNVIVEDKNIGAVGSVQYYYDHPEVVQAWGGGKVNLWFASTVECTTREESQILNYLTAASLLIRREVFTDAGSFDSDRFFMYWEDVDLCFRIRAKGWQLAVAHDAKVLHKVSASSDNNSFILHYYKSSSMKSFLLLHSPVPYLAVFLSFTVRLFVRLLRGDFTKLKALIKGYGLEF